jgi:bifunctional non-homologous end joining protein LigD
MSMVKLIRLRRISEIAKVGKRKIELSNLRKVLYPDDHVLKAELIEYYLKISPTILSHVKGRPLSLVRYPDGINGDRFFQKNRPEWAPEWIEHVVLGSTDKGDKIDYVVATEEASLVWLANLACIELHQMHCRSPHFDKPDYFVFDLDPPDNYGFEDLVMIAFELKEQIEDLRYSPFVKTTGRKGLHIVVPIEPGWTFETVFKAAQDVGRLFVESHGQIATLNIRKEDRRGKVLVDIYRNRNYQTIVSPYSVRGVPGAPVSMPLRWDQLKSVGSPAEFNLRTVPEHIMSNGDAWEGIAAYASGLHTVQKAPATRKKAVANANYARETLREYAGKRSFETTPEPLPAIAAGTGSSFVLHRHHARQLHYDLRLEKDGVLKSWAIPKGLPPRPGIMRLAVATEDHPLEYINFEGRIPKGQYGGGEMWIYASGRYEITLEKKKGFYFRLESRQFTAEYRMHLAGENEWMLERTDQPQIDWLRAPVLPMLARSADKTPDDGQYLYEVKWDGIRAMIALDEGNLRIRSRNQIDITGKFPELLIPGEAFRATSALFDAEIVCLDDSGKPVFQDVVHRIQQRGQSAVERARVKYPAVCYVFDCLYLDGRQIVNEPLVRRRSWMEDAIKHGTPYRTSEAVADGAGLFRAATEIGLEGIMAKEKNSSYLPGKRSDQWLKIKKRHTMECVIAGYTRGKGGRDDLFGALQLAVKEGKTLRYAGKVGTGFDGKIMKEIFTQLKKAARISRPVREKPPDDAQTVWVEPLVICEVQYAALTKDGRLREPVFLRLRPDLM